MSIETQLPPNKQIRNFLIVVFGGVLAGLFLVIGLVQYYTPSSTILAKNALLAPEVLRKMWYNSSNVSTGGQTQRFEFTGVEFLYFDQEGKKWTSVEVPLEAYQKFYSLVERDKSGDLRAEKSFGEAPESRILIKAATAKGIEEIFQEVQFSNDGDHYRVQLRDSDPELDWAFYTHPGVFEKVKKAFGL